MCFFWIKLLFCCRYLMPLEWPSPPVFPSSITAHPTTLQSNCCRLSITTLTWGQAKLLRIWDSRIPFTAKLLAMAISVGINSVGNNPSNLRFPLSSNHLNNSTSQHGFSIMCLSNLLSYALFYRSIIECDPIYNTGVLTMFWGQYW